MRLGRRIAAAHPFARFVVDEAWPGKAAQSDDELLDHARTTGNTTYHPIGSCRMGPADRADNVVDDRLKVHGIAALRVADASIMPTMPAANTNAGAIMIGERAADFILGERRS